METMSEIIPFAKEMLNQKPNRGMLKIYMIGSTLAVLGVVGGLLETVLLPFVEHDDAENTPVEVVMVEKKEKQVVTSDTTLIHSDAVELLEDVGMEAKAKQLVNAGQRRGSAYRIHACWRNTHLRMKKGHCIYNMNGNGGKLNSNVELVTLCSFFYCIFG